VILQFEKELFQVLEDEKIPFDAIFKKKYVNLLDEYERGDNHTTRAKSNKNASGSGGK
jgi:hypothetical protein